MSHPYTDYACRTDNIRLNKLEEQRIPALEQRIAKLEAQLGAADRKSLVTTAQPVADGTGATAAPSVSAEQWIKLGDDAQTLGRPLAARACDLAAAVTRWYEQPNVDAGDLVRLVYAFVRGEKLPEVP